MEPRSSAKGEWSEPAKDFFFQLSNFPEVKMRKRKTILGLLGAGFLLFGTAISIPAQPLSTAADKTEGLRREIRLLNLINGLELKPEQMRLIRDKADENKRQADELRSFSQAKKEELDRILEEIRQYRLANQDIPQPLVQRYHALDMELRTARVSLEETRLRLAREIEMGLDRHQVYALEKYVPCVIPPKGESRIGQAADVQGIADRLAKLRSVPDRAYEKRRALIIAKSLEGIKLKAGQALGIEGEDEAAEKIGTFYDRVRSLSEVDFEVQKENLAEEFVSLVKPKRVSLDVSKKIDIFLLSPEVIPILTAQLNRR